MIHPDAALEIVLSAAVPLETEIIDVSQGLGRAMPRALACPLDQPPYDKSKMDGYAYAAPLADAGAYRVVSTVAAGAAETGRLAPGECARVMTGAPLPLGTVGVQRKEYAAETSGVVRFTRPDEDNIILRGSFLRVGETLLEPRLLAAADLCVLASAGLSRVEVARRPRVAVLSTGSELRSAGASLGPGQIHDSNRPLLLALASALSCDARDAGIVPDDAAAIEAAAGRALEDADVLFVSGGVSVGDFDYVPAACAALGVETLFHGVAVKPGKPIFFGRRRGKHVFALPGNPLSAFIGFELFAKPFLHRLCGLSYQPRFARCRLSGTARPSTADRVEFLPATIDGSSCALPRFAGSGMAAVLAHADGFIRLDIGASPLPEGSLVDVRLVR